MTTNEVPGFLASLGMTNYYGCAVRMAVAEVKHTEVKQLDHCVRGFRCWIEKRHGYLYQRSRIGISQPQRAAKFLGSLTHASDANADAAGTQFYDRLSIPLPSSLMLTET